MELWSFISFDKFAHTFFFAILTLLMIIGFSKQYAYRNLRERPIILSILVTIFYGLTIETVQTFIPGRSIEITDVFANAFGTGIGVIMFFIIYRW